MSIYLYDLWQASLTQMPLLSSSVNWRILLTPLSTLWEYCEVELQSTKKPWEKYQIYKNVPELSIL